MDSNCEMITGQKELLGLGRDDLIEIDEPKRTETPPLWLKITRVVARWRG